MVRKVLVCVMLAVVAALAWQGLTSVPAGEEAGSLITWGKDSVWGLFPDALDGETHAGYYKPGDQSWHMLDDPADHALQHTGLTFQWQEDGVLFAVGNEAGEPYLYWYSLYGNTWYSGELPFGLGAGACIAYQPNDDYDGQTYPVPGWLYCLPGGAGFWRFWGKALYVIGADTSDSEEPPDGFLDWYTLNSDTWRYYDIEEDPEELDYEFVLGPGACIAYAPNTEYCSANQIDGYIYCLPGGGKEFWRYSIEPDSVITVGGIFPPDGSVIADATPKFQWNPSSSGQYRLEVARDEFFSLTVIDTVVYAPECQTTSELANGTYFWHVGTPDGGGWLWGDTYNFVDSAGFEPLTDIDSTVADGAAMAYYGGHPAWEVDPSILVLAGGGKTYFCRWSIGQKRWFDLDPVPYPKAAYPGTSLTTCDPLGGFGWHAVAAFGQSVDSVDRPWGYEPEGQEWFEYSEEDVDAFPQPLGPGATIVLGPSPWTYLVTGARYVGGEGTDYFYAIDPKYKKPKKPKEGSQAGDVHTASRQAQVIAFHDGVEVEYQLPAAARVRATLHDAVGRQLGVLDAGSEQPGTHRLSWSQDRGGRKLASGVYLIRLDMNEQQVKLKAIVR